MTDTLVQFLNARLADDEAAAKAATPGPWEVADGIELLLTAPNADPQTTEDIVLSDYRDPWENFTHIARHDPARVLREVEAKRRILALHTPNSWALDECPTCYDSSYIVDEGDDYQDIVWNGEVHPCKTLRMLALPYQDHPAYREEWRL